MMGYGPEGARRGTETLGLSDGTIVGGTTAEHWGNGDGDATSDGISDSDGEDC